MNLSVPLIMRQRRAALLSGLDRIPGVKVLTRSLIWPADSTPLLVEALRNQAPANLRVSIPYRDLVLKVFRAWQDCKDAA